MDAKSPRPAAIPIWISRAGRRRFGRPSTRSNGAGVLTVGGNGAALWNAGDPDRAEVVFKPHSGVSSATFSNSGHMVVTGSLDRRAKIWDAESGLSKFQLPPEHTRSINSAVFSPVDENLLVTASNDGTARIWDVTARRVLHVLAHQKQGAPARPVRQAIFSPDGKRVLSACDDAKARIWDVGSGQIVATLELDAPVHAVAYSADGERILAGGANGRAVMFDPQTGKAVVRYLGHTAAINSVAFSPDGRRALTGSSDRSAKIWDTIESDSRPISGEPFRQVSTAAEAGGPRDGKEILTLKHHDQAVTCVAFSPDGRSILTTGLDGTAVLWLTDDWRRAAQK